MHGNVLIVEDDPDSGNMMAEILETAGYSVHLVSNRDEAAIALTHYLYDYIVLDFFMFGMPIEEFMKLPAARRANTILISAVVDAKKAAERLGLDGWLRKPFDHEQLLHAVGAAG